jgi:hypothetical protein
MLQVIPWLMRLVSCSVQLDPARCVVAGSYRLQVTGAERPPVERNGKRPEDTRPDYRGIADEDGRRAAT